MCIHNKNINRYTEHISKILPYEIKVDLSEFKNTCAKCNLIALTSELTTTELWFNIFKNQVLDAIKNKKNLPICKFGDGEFIFMNNGLELIDYRLKIKDKIKILIRNTLIRLNLIKFHPFTSSKYSSGTYSYNEIKALNSRYKKNMKFILENGILASSLLISDEIFSERFFKLFFDFIVKNKIKITLFNHVPYIFVYALFAGKSKFEILINKKVLIINSFNDDQKKIITKKLKSFGAKEVLYSNISSNRSAFDKLNIDLKWDIDLILIGAGVGKLFHFEYLYKFNVPCIDIGYIFETWLHPDSSSNRAFCSDNDTYDIEKDK